jgi:hypothetical protein
LGQALDKILEQGKVLPSDMEQINERVYEMYNLDANEITIVEKALGGSKQEKSQPVAGETSEVHNTPDINPKNTSKRHGRPPKRETGLDL